MNFVPLTLNVSLTTQILEYCEYHKEEPPPAPNDESQDGTSNPPRARTTEISEWDQKFMAVDQEMLFDIILGAHYLDIKPLLSVLLNRTPDIPDIITVIWAAKPSPTWSKAKHLKKSGKYSGLSMTLLLRKR